MYNLNTQIPSRQLYLDSRYGSEVDDDGLHYATEAQKFPYKGWPDLPYAN